MINLVAGTVLLAFYLWKGIDDKDQRPYASAFLMTGLLSFITGLLLSYIQLLPNNTHRRQPKAGKASGNTGLPGFYSA